MNIAATGVREPQIEERDQEAISIFPPRLPHSRTRRKHFTYLKSVAGHFACGYNEANPALLTKMTGPAHRTETTYEPHRDLITGVRDRSIGILSVNRAGTSDPAPDAPSLPGAPTNTNTTTHQDPKSKIADEVRTLQGAGGVGSLLAISDRSNPDAQVGSSGPLDRVAPARPYRHRYPAYDANGNVGQLLDEDGEVVAAYAYDPFGNVTEMTGPEAAENPWRFSTKPVEEGTGWSYYGFRYYTPTEGRWASRDPLGDEMFFRMYSEGRELPFVASIREESLKMPYGFVSNDPVNQSDNYGLWAYKKCGNFVLRTLIGAEERFGFPGAIASRFLAPHSFIVTDDGELLDYFGTGGDDHWTATSWPLMIPKCLECGEYTSCLKAEYSACSTNNPDWSWTNNCNSYVADAISRCNKKLFTAEIITQSYLNKCCGEND